MMFASRTRTVKFDNGDDNDDDNDIKDIDVLFDCRYPHQNQLTKIAGLFYSILCNCTRALVTICYL